MKRTVLITAALALACVAMAHAKPVQAAGLQVVECQVYPVEKPTAIFDCRANIAKACAAADPCEVVIGLGLTDGRQIDDNAKAWKKVRVRYQCASGIKTVGPYVQSEHATIRITCGGMTG